MAIVKATYTKQSRGAKASIRYIQHRKGKEGERVNRPLFGSDGLMGRWEAYRMIDEAQKGSVFFRFVISPDPKGEDSKQDLRLREITERTMNTLEERLHKPILWVAVVQGRLQVQDFQSLRAQATAACLEQRRELDQVLEQKEQEREEVQWEA